MQVLHDSVFQSYIFAIRNGQNNVSRDQYDMPKWLENNLTPNKNLFSNICIWQCVPMNVWVSMWRKNVYNAVHMRYMRLNKK